ncbi:MAG: ribokinase [Ignavibacteriaceae bacterium]|nr:ribokinase [Ignavibacteriaceae bacterium]
MSKKIVVVGSSNTDMIIQLKRLPKPGETIVGGVFTTAAGGKGANQAVAAVRAGGDVTFICRIGSDMFGDTSFKGFINDRLDISGIIRDEKEPSGVALIFVDEKGENSIAVAPGANGKLSPDDIYKMKDIIVTADILLMQLEIPLETVEAAAKIAAENNVRIILNPAPARHLSDSLLEKISIITPNETEAEILTGVAVNNEEDAEKAAKVLMQKGVETVIITLGSKGAFAFNKTFKEVIPSYKVKAVDTTAAGDVFNGALTVALSEGKNLKDAILFANAAAALSVTKLGAQPSAPYKSDIKEMLNN